MIIERVEHMRALLRGLADMIVILSPDGELIESAVYHSGLIRPKHVRHFLESVPAAAHRIALMRAYLRTASAGAVERAEVCQEARDGQFVWLETSFVPMPAPSGELERIAVVFRDVTVRKAEEGRLRVLAFHDTLTSLPNRRLFMEHMKLSVGHAKRNKGILALLRIDIDDFKDVNDSYGHDAGDEYLRAFAQRLRRCIREVDTLARIGGDEFTILLPAVDSIAGVTVVAERLYRALQEPLDVGGASLPAAISTGIAVFPPHGTDTQTLLKNADIALYEVKRLGKNRYRYYRRAESPS